MTNLSTSIRPLQQGGTSDPPPGTPVAATTTPAPVETAVAANPATTDTYNNCTDSRFFDVGFPPDGNGCVQASLGDVSPLFDYFAQPGFADNVESTWADGRIVVFVPDDYPDEWGLQITDPSQPMTLEALQAREDQLLAHLNAGFESAQAYNESNGLHGLYISEEALMYDFIQSPEILYVPVDIGIAGSPYLDPQLTQNALNWALSSLPVNIDIANLSMANPVLVTGLDDQHVDMITHVENFIQSISEQDITPVIKMIDFQPAA